MRRRTVQTDGRFRAVLHQDEEIGHLRQIREALRALQGSPLNGNLGGGVQENAFAAFLHEQGIVNALRIEDNKDAGDLGRKWRSALTQLGFITPLLTRGTPSGAVDPALVPLISDIEELSGRPYEITPNGYRLANSEIITAQQECFLRSLATYRIPSPLERNYKFPDFCPLIYVLQIMHGLISGGNNGTVSFQEFALFIQTSTPEDGLPQVVKNITDYRAGRELAKGKVRPYDQGFYRRTAVDVDKKEETLNDYADLSLRYLKATGLFRNSGRGIAIVPARTQLAELLRQQPRAVLDDSIYFHSLWLGAKLPTDDVNSSYLVVTDLVTQLNSRGIPTNLPPATTPLIDLENIRHELEALLAKLDEEEYARDQVNHLAEISAWMRAIPVRGSARLPNGATVSVPRGEAPAYLEWVIWRAFLAINSLSNASWDARRFQIDQDFLPVSCAPGGGPDMVFEFNNAIIVVEVTLTASSRQEAAEGEPVRRHVAQFAEAAHKPVYGLFIAVQIDSNTAHTFRSGDWYRQNDSKTTLDIVPISLADFQAFFDSAEGRLSSMPALLLQLLIECRARANQDAPQWKQSISAITKRISMPS